jgi:predicted PurR-regulated permease PerM
MVVHERVRRPSGASGGIAARPGTHPARVAARLDGDLRAVPRGRRAGHSSPEVPGAAPRVPGALVTAAAWAWRLLVVGAVVWLVVRFLAGLTLVTVPIVLGLLLAALLQRPVLVLRRYLPRWLAALTVLVLALGLLAGVGYLVAWRVQGQTARLVDQAAGILGDLRARVADLPGIGAGSSSLVDRATQWLQAHESTVLTGALTVGTVAVEVVTGFVLTLFLTLFLLLDGDRIWAWCVRLRPRRVRPAANGAGHRAWRVLSGWIGGTALIALIHAVVIGTALWLLGVPLVLALAVLVFIGSFVPIVGAVVFGGFACLVTFVTVGLGKALVLLGVLLVEDLLEGHVYQPLIMGRTVRLHPVTVLLALAIGGELDGIVGAIIAIPLAAAVHAAVKYLTGIEDIDGGPLRDEDRMAPEPPPVAVRRPGPR